MSELVQSGALGRQLRVGSAERLGIPTHELAIDAFESGDLTATRALVEYLIDESAQVWWIFRTWLEDMLAYGEDHVPNFEGHRSRLEGIIGAAPSLTDPQDIACDAKD